MATFYYERDKLNELKKKIRRINKERGVAPPDFGSGPFFWLLSNVSTDKPRRYNTAWPEDITRPMISRFDRQIRYAYRHKIPVELLIGFLFQCGKPDHVYRKENLGSVESWHSSRVASVGGALPFGPILDQTLFGAR